MDTVRDRALLLRALGRKQREGDRGLLDGAQVRSDGREGGSHGGSLLWAEEHALGNVPWQRHVVVTIAGVREGIILGVKITKDARAGHPGHGVDEDCD